MIDSITNPAPQRRWLDWGSGAPITAEAAGTEPTKPSELGFDGFDGSAPVQLQEIEALLRLKSTTSAVDSSTPTERVMSWAEWKAGALNQLFLELGNSGQPGRITADTIRRGERAWMTNLKNRDVTSEKSSRAE